MIINLHNSKNFNASNSKYQMILFANVSRNLIIIIIIIIIIIVIIIIIMEEPREPYPTVTQ